MISERDGPIPSLRNVGLRINDGDEHASVKLGPPAIAGNELPHKPAAHASITLDGCSGRIVSIGAPYQVP